MTLDLVAPRSAWRQLPQPDVSTASRPTASERRVLADRRTASHSATADHMARGGFPERRIGPDRRRSAFHQWRHIQLGGLPVVVADRDETARVIVGEALRRHGLWRYPAYLTSTNGEVTYRCAVSPAEKLLFLAADAIHADGAAHVFASRLHDASGLPERVATSDLFDDVAAVAAREGATMFMLGATEPVNRAAFERVRARFPGLKLVGRRHGYFADSGEERAACTEIAALAPDILWVSMGVPREQRFALEHRCHLTSVGVVKTSGGLFDFLSGDKRRAPLWMQRVGLEWLWRAGLEPRRLGRRYLTTNPLALYLLIQRRQGG